MTAGALRLPDYDFVSRFFGPAAGIDEDPVTGSAHCCLGPYWSAKRGKAALGSTRQRGGPPPDKARDAAGR
jgi:predicted PhzF superfamily epimerase YddE/YHI9